MVNDNAPDDDAGIPDQDQDPEVPLLNEVEAAPAHNHAHKKPAEWPSKLKRVIIADAEKASLKRILELSGFIIALAVLYVYSRQLNVMDRQLQEMKESGAQSLQLIFNAAHQAKATSDLAQAAKSTANTADQTLQSNQANFRNEQRPYIWAFPKPDQEAGFVKDGTWDVYVVGGIRYRDIFHPRIEPYETRYCFVWNNVGVPFGDCSFNEYIH